MDITFVRFECPYQDIISSEYGPYEFVQITKDELIVGHNAELTDTLACYKNGYWHVFDIPNKKFNNIVIFGFKE